MWYHWLIYPLAWVVVEMGWYSCTYTKVGKSEQEFTNRRRGGNHVMNFTFKDTEIGIWTSFQRTPILICLLRKSQNSMCKMQGNGHVCGRASTTIGGFVMWRRRGWGVGEKRVILNATSIFLWPRLWQKTISMFLCVLVASTSDSGWVNRDKSPDWEKLKVQVWG